MIKQFQMMGEESDMNFNEFSEFARTRQLHQVENSAFGFYDTFPYKLVHNPKTIGGNVSGQGFTVLLLLDGKPAAALVKQLRRAVRPFKVLVSQPVANSVGISFPKKRANGETFDAVLSKTVELLRNGGLSGVSQCPVCGGQNCDILLDWKGFYRPAHQSCVEPVISAGVENAQNRIQNGSYLTGTLGALVGSFLGAIPSFLSIWLGNRVFAVLFALIPLGAYFGYKLARGKMTRLVTVITIVVSLVQLFVLEQLIFYFAVVEAYKMYPSIFETVTYYFQYFTFSEIVASMGTEFLFLLLGIWISWRLITQTGYSEVNSLKNTAATIQPYSNGSATQTTTVAAAPTPTTVPASYSSAEETYMKPEKDPWEN